MGQPAAVMERHSITAELTCRADDRSATGCLCLFEYFQTAVLKSVCLECADECVCVLGR